MYNIHQVWQAVLAEFELKLSKANFITWFKHTCIKCFEEGTVVVCVPSLFAKSWLERKFHHEILKTLERITNQPIKKIEYRVENVKKILEEVPMPLPTPTATQPSTFSAAPLPQNNLNTKYRFEHFIVGKGNELAVAAAHAVAENAGRSYNPLFVYGSVGLGKTHLLQAIGHGIIKKEPGAKVLYTTIEKFKNDLVEAVRAGDAGKLKYIYRNVDVLLIDDIQFISGKEGTQEEFFHTFNELHQQNKQIVISSDRPPKAIPALEARLRTRFEWGMIVDITAPDFETRLAIINTKAQERGCALSEEIIQTVAITIQNNIRELEGAVNKIIAYQQLKNIDLSVEVVKSLLSNLESQSARRSVTPKTVIKVIAEFFDLTPQEILGKNREKRLSFPRQIIMYMLREDMKLSFPTIGGELGGRDHTTAMHAYEKIFKEAEQDLKLKNELELIRQRLYHSTG